MGVYRSSYRGIGEMLCAPFMIAEMERRANAGKSYAESIAPEKTGEYKASFEVESGIRQGKTRRAFGRLKNTDPKAFYLEVGTEDTPKFRVLGKSLDHMK